ncbi:Calcineurin-like phosphoesterase, partial [Snodgrassella alvi SCGC AB-598-J21]
MYSDSCSFIRPLPASTALDVIGDVHGEWEALQQLLHFLGYDENGRHKHGRKLVFVGDLCDRGPDSPAVLDWVIQAVAAENAFTIIGNHELNLLIDDPKDGSGWYFDNRPQDETRFAPWQHYPKDKRRQLQETMAQWPLILQRDDLRIVHAAWLPDSIDKLIHCSEKSLIKQYHYWENRFFDDFHQTEWYESYIQETQQLKTELEDENYTMPFQPGVAHYDLLRSCHNPIRALTSGIQALTQQPFYINGRWRFTVRKPWWQQYTDPVAVIIGHYWRSWYGTAGVAEHRKDLFPEPPTHWLG